MSLAQQVHELARRPSSIFSRTFWSLLPFTFASIVSSETVTSSTRLIAKYRNPRTHASGGNARATRSESVIGAGACGPRPRGPSGGAW
jgi:hypothetical protein